MSKVSLWVALLLLAAATAAGAAERGQIGIQAQGFVGLGHSSREGWFGQVQPGLGFTYQLTPRLALRPELGFGVSERHGNIFRAGLLGAWSLRSGGWRPYLLGGLAYTHRDVAAGAADLTDRPAAPGSIGRNTVTLQAGFGVERVLGRRFSLFAEAGAGYTPGERYEWARDGWQRRSGWEADVPLRTTVGFTFNLR